VTSRLAIVIAALIAAAACAGTSWAYFASQGTGTGSATAASAQPVTLSPATPATGLYPGSSADVAFTVSNPNGGPVVIPSVALDTSQGSNGLGVDGSHTGCALSALTFTSTPGSWTIPAHASAFAIDLPGSISLSPSAADACQGATFTVYLKVGP
jgi:hypothetical protein